MSEVNFWEIEESHFEKGVEIICGVDEAGRGPLAGPVCAAAVILPADYYHEKLNDSKKISPKTRDILFDDICKNAISYGIAFASVEEIDQINILNAALLAMRRAVALLDPQADFLLIDGNVSRGFTGNFKTVVHGDAISPSIAAASVLAKVSRDRLLVELDRQYPEYQLAQHKGYCTKLHKELLQRYGPNEIYRTSFLKKVLK
jgi:ribonuclease HII